MALPDAPATLDGGCQCGRVRFRARLSSLDAYACHCRMCQRAFGSLWVGFVGCDKADVIWMDRAPDLYRSSPIAERGFCAACGTSLSFWYAEADTMDLAVAAFDQPGLFTPRHNFGVEGRMGRWMRLDALPGMRTTDHLPLMARWANAGAEPPQWP